MDHGPDPRFPPQPADLSRIVARGLSPGEPWELFFVELARSLLGGICIFGLRASREASRARSAGYPGSQRKLRKTRPNFATATRSSGKRKIVKESPPAAPTYWYESVSRSRLIVKELGGEADDDHQRMVA